MVSVDAFSQAFTNPLLGKQVFNADTFTPFGWDLIHETSTLHDVLERNSPAGLGPQRISMTRANWQLE
jgi:prostaglandin-endoperoxide synthase 2